MSGIATSCKDNQRMNRQGCGATYSGNMVHCTAAAEWSTHPDGLCHETFSTYSAMDRHLGVSRSGDLWHRDPRGVDGLHRDDRGAWRQDAHAGWRTSRLSVPYSAPESSHRVS